MLKLGGSKVPLQICDEEPSNQSLKFQSGVDYVLHMLRFGLFPKDETGWGEVMRATPTHNALLRKLSYAKFSFIDPFKLFLASMLLLDSMSGENINPSVTNRKLLNGDSNVFLFFSWKKNLILSPVFLPHHDRLCKSLSTAYVRTLLPCLRPHRATINTGNVPRRC